MGQVLLDRPWLQLDLGAPMQVLSWAVHRPGFVTAQRILWREVRNQDLPPDLDVGPWLQGELAARGAGEAVTFLTSRDVTCFTQAQAMAEGIRAHAVATTGLSNAERVGVRMDYGDRDWGTINVAVQLSEGLTQTALIEALSIAVQARTAAVIEGQPRLNSVIFGSHFFSVRATTPTPEPWPSHAKNPHPNF